MIRDVHQHVIWLVVGIPTPLKNDGMSSSVGMMTFPIYGKYWKVIKNVPVTTDQFWVLWFVMGEFHPASGHPVGWQWTSARWPVDRFVCLARFGGSGYKYIKLIWHDSLMMFMLEFKGVSRVSTHLYQPMYYDMSWLGWRRYKLNLFWSDWQRSPQFEPPDLSGCCSKNSRSWPNLSFLGSSWSFKKRNMKASLSEKRDEKVGCFLLDHPADCQWMTGGDVAYQWMN